MATNGGIVVLPKGYVGKRQPETWSLQRLTDNMQAALQQKSRHDIITQKVERPRGTRNVLTMMCEYLHDNPIVKVFYDWDFTLPIGLLTSFRDMHTQEELNATQTSLNQLIAEQLAAFKAAVVRAHPDVPDPDFAFADRTGWKVKPKTASWFISLRCFVQGRSMRVGDIRRHIDNVFGKSEVPELDRSVYKPSEQCLALVGGHKDSSDKRVLVPLTHLEDLAAFVVQDVSNCQFIELPTDTIVPAPSITEGIVPRKRKNSDVQQSSSSSRSDPVRSWIGQQFEVDPTVIILDKVKTVSSDGTRTSYTIPTSTRDCPFAKREHSGNHLYFTVTVYSNNINMYLKCHDSDCRQYFKGLDRDSTVPLDVQNAFKELVSSCDTIHTTSDTALGEPNPSGDDNDISDKAKKDAARQGLSVLQKMYPKMNCAVDDESDLLKPTTLAPGGFVTLLNNNYYCPLHKEMHDGCDNCVFYTDVQQQLLCRQDMSRTLPFAMDKNQVNIIFANINNINITQSESGSEVRDFGGPEDFPALFSDSKLNLLCHASLDGATITFAKFAAEMVKGKYVFQDNTWYHFKGRVWIKDPGPDDLIGTELVALYKRLRKSYTTTQQLKWLSLLINDLGNLNKRKPYTEELERHVTREMDTRIPFDEDPHLIGFQNGVYNTKACVFREHQPQDYLTVLQPYELPEHPDMSIRTEIENFFIDLLPSQQVREYVLLLLALHLEGSNKHAVGMIWSGTGGNGKSVLKDLMNHTFGPLHSEPPATFLTSERPSPEKPAPHLVDLRYKRSVITSEPEVGKKTNSAFLKFITGNDKVTCRALHSNDMISFVPRFIITLLCNVIPLFQGGQDEVRALWRRLKIIHFPTEFVDVILEGNEHQRLKDADLPDKLPLWAPHFMSMLVEVYQEYVRGGRRLRSAPPEVEQNLDDQKAENNPLERFLKDRLVQAPDHVIHPHALRTEFTKYLQENYPKPEVVESVVKFTQRLESMGYAISADKKKQRACCDISRRSLLGWKLSDGSE